MDFGDQVVIRDLSFDVQVGETFGFLGSNGSGKTTTLRALLGIYQATAGTLHIDGKVFEPRDGARLGYLPEERGLYKKESVLVIMVTHQMEEVERLCDRVLLLKDGTAEAYGTVEDVQDRYGGTTIRLHHSGPLPASDLYDIRVAEHNYAELSPRAGTDETDILRELVQRGVSVRSFATARTSLEEIFIRVYGAQTEPSGA